MTRIRWKLLVSMLTIVVVTVGLSAALTRSLTHAQVRRLIVSKRQMMAATPGAPAQPVMTTHVYSLPPTTEPAEAREIAMLDERLLATFAGAAIVAVILTLLLSRRITSPIEQLTAAVQQMARGSVPAHVAVPGRDEIARLATAFNAMADSIARQDELRRRMVGDVAHELRTPLTNLRCEIEALQDGLANPDSSRLASLHEEVLHLGHLADDLQDLAVADAGGLQLHCEPIDLMPALRRVVDLCARDETAVTMTGPESLPIRADALRITQIFRNLLDNAVRHANRIDISVADAGGNVAVAITDNGPGIPPDELERIFERFYRVDDARTREGGGAGLGLAIVRRLVELHHGTVRAENVPDGGARFRVELPRA